MNKNDFINPNFKDISFDVYEESYLKDVKIRHFSIEPWERLCLGLNCLVNIILIDSPTDVIEIDHYDYFEASEESENNTLNIKSLAPEFVISHKNKKTSELTTYSVLKN